jgi:hypothetical protein
MYLALSDTEFDRRCGSEILDCFSDPVPTLATAGREGWRPDRKGLVRKRTIGEGEQP